MPFCTTPIMKSVIVAAVSGVITVSHGFGVYVSSTAPSLSRVSAITCGVMITPLLATAAAAMFICSGVAAGSSWPKLDVASFGLTPLGTSFTKSCTDGKNDCAGAGMSMGTSWLKPNASAVVTMVSGPSVVPISAKAVLHDAGEHLGKRAAAHLAAVVLIGVGSGRHDVLVGRREERVHVVLAALERRRGGDDLERRPGHVALLVGVHAAAAWPGRPADASRAALAALKSWVAMVFGS